MELNVSRIFGQICLKSDRREQMNSFHLNVILKHDHLLMLFSVPRDLLFLLVILSARSFVELYWLEVDRVGHLWSFISSQSAFMILAKSLLHFLGKHVTNAFRRKETWLMSTYMTSYEQWLWVKLLILLLMHLLLLFLSLLLGHSV